LGARGATGQRGPTGPAGSGGSGAVVAARNWPQLDTSGISAGQTLTTGSWTLTPACHTSGDPPQFQYGLELHLTGPSGYDNTIFFYDPAITNGASAGAFIAQAPGEDLQVVPAISFEEQGPVEICHVAVVTTAVSTS